MKNLVSIEWLFCTCKVNFIWPPLPSKEKKAKPFQWLEETCNWILNYVHYFSVSIEMDAKAASEMMNIIKAKEETRIRFSSKLLAWWWWCSCYLFLVSKSLYIFLPKIFVVLNVLSNIYITLAHGLVTEKKARADAVMQRYIPKSPLIVKLITVPNLFSDFSIFS